MKPKRFVCILLALVIILPAIASASNMTILNASSTTDTMDTLYPTNLFYGLLGVSFLALFIVIWAAFVSDPVRPSVVAIMSGIGFCTFLICAYMTPLTGTSTWVTSNGEVKLMLAYSFSPWMAYLWYGFSMICFTFIWYGVILYFRMIQQNKERLERDQMYAITGIDVD